MVQKARLMRAMRGLPAFLLNDYLRFGELPGSRTFFLCNYHFVLILFNLLEFAQVALKRPLRPLGLTRAAHKMENDNLAHQAGGQLAAISPGNDCEPQCLVPTKNKVFRSVAFRCGSKISMG